MNELGVKEMYVVVPGNVIDPDLEGMVRIAFLDLNPEEVKSWEYNPDTSRLPDFIYEVKLFSEDRVLRLDVTKSKVLEILKRVMENQAMYKHVVKWSNGDTKKKKKIEAVFVMQ